MSLMFS